jgi:hypothetical protein
MRQFLRNFGVEVSPAPTPPAAPKQPRKKGAIEKPKKEPAKAPPLFPEVQETVEQAVPIVPAETRDVPQLLKGLSPLQQGFVWAEILGPAKAMQE